jgi:hypothetical protein
LAFCVVALTAVLVTSTPAFAYSLEGARWAGTPTSGCCANIHVSPNGTSDSSGLNLMSSFDAQGFRDAVARYNGPGPNVVLCFCSGALKLYDPTVANVSWDGQTTWDTNLFSNTFSYANVKINTYYTRNDSATTIKGIAEHELGHAMGLAHNSTCGAAIMYPNTGGCRPSDLTSDDIAGINSLY